MDELLANFGWMVPVTLAQGLILSFVSLAIMIPFRILNFQDMTCEGAFPFGGCTCAVALTLGWPPVLAVLAGTLGGFLAGSATAFIHLRFRIHSLLSGILVATMLYSANLRIMGKSNLSLFSLPNIYELAPFQNGSAPEAKIFIAGFLALGVWLLLKWFFTTEKGVGVRAVGSSPDMATAQGIHVFNVVIGGVALASACAGLAGALMVQSQGFADVNMGFGVLINGLAALMIGEAIIGKRSLPWQLLAPFVGSLVYYLLVSVCLSVGMPPPDLKLATGLFVLTMLAVPRLRPK